MGRLMEEFFHLQPAVDQTLLQRKLDEALQVLAVTAQAIGPGQMASVGVIVVVEGHLLGWLEDVGETHGDFRVRVQHLRPGMAQA